MGLKFILKAELPATIRRSVASEGKLMGLGGKAEMKFNRVFIRIHILKSSKTRKLTDDYIYTNTYKTVFRVDSLGVSER